MIKCKIKRRIICYKQRHINNNIKVKCIFGERDSSPSEYPVIQVRMVDDFDIFRGNEKLLTQDLPLQLRIIVSKENEYDALEVLDRLYQKMNQFNPHKGNMFEGTGTPEYVEETKTFEISIPYTLKLMIQDTLGDNYGIILLYRY